MKILTKLLLAFVSFISISSHATVYYIDYDTGSDANSGTSTTWPWKTSQPVQLNASNFLPGDQILIKRGTVMYPNGWTLKLTSSGNSANPIVIGAYDTGNAPIIDDRYDLIKNGKGWTPEGVNIWSCSYVSWDPKRVWLNGVEKMSADGPGDINNLSEAYPWIYANEKLYVYSLNNPSSTFTKIEVLKSANLIRLEGCSNIEVKDLDLRGGADGAVLLKGAQNVNIHDCKIGYSYHGIRFFPGAQRNQDVNIYNNDINSHFESNYPTFEYFFIGDGIQLLEGYSNKIYDNQFVNWAHSGVNIAAAVDSNNGVQNTSVYNNYFTAYGVSYGRAWECTGVQGKCTGNEIYDNTIYDTPTRCQLGGSNNYVYSNIFDTRRNNTYKGWGVGQAIYIITEGYSGTRESRYLYVYNNIFMNTAEPAIEMNTFSGTENWVDKPGIEVNNNIFYNCGHDALPVNNSNIALRIDDMYPGCFKDDFIESNVFYNNSTESIIRLRAYGLFIVDGFNAYSGIGNNIFRNNTFQNPLLNSDYSVGNASCIGATVFSSFSGTCGSWLFSINANDSCGVNNGTLCNGALISENSLTLDGSNDYVNLGNNSSLQMQLNNISLSLWVKMQNNGSDYQVIFTKGASTPTDAGYALIYNNSTGKLFFEISDGATRLYPKTVNSYASVLMDGAWHHLAVIANRAGEVKFYIDGDSAPAESNNISSYSSTSIGGSTAAYIGKWGSLYFKGQIDEVRMYKKIISSNYIKMIYHIGSSIFKSEDITAGMWSFDNGGDDTCELNNGTLFGAVINTSSAVFGNSLSLDGNNDYVDLGNNSSLQMQLSNISLSLWVKMQNNGSDYQVIFTKGASTPTDAGYALIYNNSTGKLFFEISDGATRLYPKTVNSYASVLMDGAWHHLAVIANRAGEVKFYIDGDSAPAESNNISSYSSTSIGGSTAAYIGKWGSLYFKGQIDEVRMYKNMLPENYIKLLYASGISNLR